MAVAVFFAGGEPPARGAHVSDADGRLRPVSGLEFLQRGLVFRAPCHVGPCRGDQAVVRTVGAYSWLSGGPFGTERSMRAVLAADWR